MEPEVTKEYVEDNHSVVSNIILWRIYDLMLLILMDKDPDAARRVAEMHEAGQFLGPNPAYSEETND
jgi:hypothetical protein